MGGAISGFVICFVEELPRGTDRGDPAICGESVGGPGETKGLTVPAIKLVTAAGAGTEGGCPAASAAVA